MVCIANIRQNVTSWPDQVNYSSYLLRNPYCAEHAVTHIWLSVVQKEQVVRRMRGPLKATAHKLQHKPRCSGAKACHTQGKAQFHAAKSWHNFNQHLKLKGMFRIVIGIFVPCITRVSVYHFWRCPAPPAAWNWPPQVGVSGSHCH